MAEVGVGGGVEPTYSVSTLVQDKYIGLGLAIASSVAIGTSFIITKKGLQDAASRSKNSDRTGPVDSTEYLKNPIWWAGMLTMAVGEIANFTAYAFAPPVLVTPLGALSVLIGAVLAAIFLNEELGRIGGIGCALCLLGSLVIVLHAPEDKEIKTVDEILNYATQPGFMFYSLSCLVFCVYMIYKVAPRHGTTNPLVYLSICSLAGSISVMAIKGLGVALKLTFAGNNQLTHFPTYVFGITVAVCIATQMNYFNKALDTFSTNVVNPIYYVFFSTATILASMILFRGLNTSGAVNSVSLICGFLTTFSGVYLLNLSRSIPSGASVDEDPQSRHRRRVSHGLLETGMLNPRISISSEGARGHGHGQGNRHGRGDSFDSLPTDEDEAYPLRNKRRTSREHYAAHAHAHSSGSVGSPGSRQGSISSYNHQAAGLSNSSNSIGGYAAVGGTDTDRDDAGGRRGPSKNEVVFDIGNDDDDGDLIGREVSPTSGGRGR